jgi:hypothetical protein
LEKKTEIVFVCPYCVGSVWFPNEFGLAGHIQKSHRLEAILDIARQNKFKASKTARSWNIDVSGNRR